jgi:hypothetical protein
MSGDFAEGRCMLGRRLPLKDRAGNRLPCSPVKPSVPYIGCFAYLLSIATVPCYIFFYVCISR